MLYRNRNGRVAHECIVDPRPLKDSCGVTVDDIAKRLIDYGFHAPTMSFPVPGTLMIEPTESEAKVELDRFCDAHDRNPPGNRRHRARPAQRSSNRRCGTRRTPRRTWSRMCGSAPIARAEGCFPGGVIAASKYWPPVSRIDNVYGDRHLVCSCPPIEDYTQAAE